MESFTMDIDDNYLVVKCKNKDSDIFFCISNRGLWLLYSDGFPLN